MATTTTRMTFAEFERLPQPGGSRYELRHGELVPLPPPKHKHKLVQRRLRRLLENAAADAGVVETEVGFRPLPDFAFLIADLAFVSNGRWEQIDPYGYLMGAPELVVEILSPSNTADEMLDKEKLCLENGCREFWIVDTGRKQVKVSTPDGVTKTYRGGQEMPVVFKTGAKIPVDAIFA